MTQPAIVGIDLGKNWFHLVALEAAGAAVFRKKMNRTQLAQSAATAPRCIVANESCPGSQMVRICCKVLTSEEEFHPYPRNAESLRIARSTLL